MSASYTSQKQTLNLEIFTKTGPKFPEFFSRAEVTAVFFSKSEPAKSKAPPKNWLKVMGIIS